MTATSAGPKIFAVVVAVGMAAVWPAKSEALPFVMIGLALILFPGNRWIQSWLSRGLPLSESPPFALSLVGWLFVIGMPLLFGWLIP